MAQNFREYLDTLLAGVGYLRGYWGSRLRGAVATLADLVAEGTREAVHARWTRACHDDALGEIGASRAMPRYPGEAVPQYRARLREAFDSHAQSGTSIGLANELNIFGLVGARVFEDWQWHRPPQPWWSQGWIWMPAGSHSVAPSTLVFGGGGVAGTGLVTGLTGISVAEVDGVRRLVRARKRASFVFREMIFELTGHVTFGTGVITGGGAITGSPPGQALLGLE